MVVTEERHSIMRSHVDSAFSYINLVNCDQHITTSTQSINYIAYSCRYIKLFDNDKTTIVVSLRAILVPSVSL
jgi:hypothetical protein